MYLDPAIRMNLMYVLDRERRAILNRYASFVDCLTECLEKKEGFSVERLRTFLLHHRVGGNSASDSSGFFKSTEFVNELKEADTINKIIDLIGTKCASFVHYDIFQDMKDQFCSDCNDDNLNYSGYFNAYIKRHNISEFFSINPNLRDEYPTHESQEFTLKLGNV